MLLNFCFACNVICLCYFVSSRGINIWLYKCLVGSNVKYWHTTNQTEDMQNKNNSSCYCKQIAVYVSVRNQTKKPFFSLRIASLGQYSTHDMVPACATSKSCLHVSVSMYFQHSLSVYSSLHSFKCFLYQ